MGALPVCPAQECRSSLVAVLQWNPHDTAASLQREHGQILSLCHTLFLVEGPAVKPNQCSQAMPWGTSHD